MKEKQYILKENTLAFLRENIKNIDILTKVERLLQKKMIENKSASFSIQFTPSEIEILLDELTFLFTLQGVDENNEPNTFGICIEELIDVFSSQN